MSRDGAYHREIVAKARATPGAEYVLFDCDAAPLLDLPVLHLDFADPA